MVKIELYLSKFYRQHWDFKYFIADDGYVSTKWRQERIWIEAVEKESKAIQEWAEKWSFLTDYDQKVLTLSFRIILKK